jgi:N-acylneuraminate cytidylyltransferase/CMP-N,N'-diacetyllegionaminic acid synthase
MINNKKVLAVITARAGSQGIKNKNFKNFCFKPLFVWSVEAALNSHYIDKIAISTNSFEIKSIAKSLREKFKLNDKTFIIDRPDEMCTSTSMNEEALIHSVNYFVEKGYFPDYIVNLQPTSPIRKKNLIDDCLVKITESNKNTLLTCSKHTPFFIKNNNDNTDFLFDRLNRKMRQQFTKDDFLYHDDGCLYITDSKTLFKEKCRLDSNPYIYENNKYSSFQIDDEDDWLILESIKNKLDSTFI